MTVIDDAADAARRLRAGVAEVATGIDGVRDGLDERAAMIADLGAMGVAGLLANGAEALKRAGHLLAAALEAADAVVAALVAIPGCAGLRGVAGHVVAAGRGLERVAAGVAGAGESVDDAVAAVQEARLADLSEVLVGWRVRLDDVAGASPVAADRVEAARRVVAELGGDTGTAGPGSPGAGRGHVAAGMGGIWPSGPPGGAPSGSPAQVSPRDKQEAGQGVTGENAAALLAGRGFVVVQSPSPEQVAAARDHHGDIGDPDKNPDYLVEGRVFDCYTPKASTSPRNAWRYVADKVSDGQAQRVVVNLRDWRGDPDALRAQFADWPIQGLKELVVVTGDGHVLHWTPDPRG